MLVRAGCYVERVGQIWGRDWQNALLQLRQEHTAVLPLASRAPTEMSTGLEGGLERRCWVVSSAWAMHTDKEQWWTTVLSTVWPSKQERGLFPITQEEHIENNVLILTEALTGQITLSGSRWDCWELEHKRCKGRMKGWDLIGKEQRRLWSMVVVVEKLTSNLPIHVKTFPKGCIFIGLHCGTTTKIVKMLKWKMFLMNRKQKKWRIIEQQNKLPRTYLWLSLRPG